MKLMDLITNGVVPRSPFKLATVPAPVEEPETLRKSPFILLDEEPQPAQDSRGKLSVADVDHLTMGYRYGKPWHRLEVEALLKSFDADGDATHLLRAISILEHLIALDSWKR